MVARLRTLAPPELREQVRDALRGDPWVHRRGREPVPLLPLVSPLRYDVVVRVAFLRLLEEHGATADRLSSSLHDAALEHPYFVWYRDLFCPAWAPELLADDDVLRRAFAERVRATARLRDSFRADGFSTARPVTLLSGVAIGPTRTGKRLARRLFAGDGCHRPALLLADGRTELSGDMYRVRHFARLTPPDTTAHLVGALALAPDEHCRFVASGYGLDPVGDRTALLDAAARRGAALADEVRRVVEVDMAHVQEDAG